MPDFHDVFLRFWWPVYRFFRKRGIRSAVAEELTQDVFLRVSNGLEAYREAASLANWIFPIAINVYRNHLRAQATHKRRGTEVELESGAPDRGPAVSALEDLVWRAEAECIRKGLTGFPRQMMRCLVLRVVGGKSYKQIAILLQIQPGTVKKHLAEGRKRLSDLVEACREADASTGAQSG